MVFLGYVNLLISIAIRHLQSLSCAPGTQATGLDILLVIPRVLLKSVSRKISVFFDNGRIENIPLVPNGGYPINLTNSTRNHSIVKEDNSSWECLLVHLHNSLHSFFLDPVDSEKIIILGWRDKF